MGVFGNKPILQPVIAGALTLITAIIGSLTVNSVLSVPYITDQQVYFSDRGNAAGDAGLTFASSTDQLTVGGAVSSTILRVNGGALGALAVRVGNETTGFFSNNNQTLAMIHNGNVAAQFGTAIATIGATVEPQTGNTLDLGTTLFRWRDIWLNGTARATNVSTTNLVASQGGITPNTNMGATTPARIQSSAIGTVPLALGNSNGAGFTGFEMYPQTGTVQGFIGYDNSNNSLRYNILTAAGYQTFLTNGTERLRVTNTDVSTTVPLLVTGATSTASFNALVQGNGQYQYGLRAQAGSIITTVGSNSVNSRGSIGTISPHNFELFTNSNVKWVIDTNGAFFPATNVFIGDVASTNKLLGLFVTSTQITTGTTGSQTINDKTLGCVNFAAAAGSLTVTTNQATAGAIIFLTVASNDATMKNARYTQTVGSFTIYPDAPPTAETKVCYQIWR